MTTDRPSGVIVAVRGRCSRPLDEPCRCWRPRGHKGECACTCTTYGSVHGAVAVPAASAALVTDVPWGFNAPLRREALRDGGPR